MCSARTAQKHHPNQAFTSSLSRLDLRTETFRNFDVDDGLHYASSCKNRYAYRQEGFDVRTPPAGGGGV